MFALACRSLAIAAVAALLAGCSASNAFPAAQTVMPAAPQGNAATSTHNFTVAPVALNFTTNQQLKLTVREANYKGPFRISISPSGVVNYSAGRFVGPSSTITLSAVATVAKAILTITDNRGVSRSVRITVTRCFIIAP